MKKQLLIEQIKKWMKEHTDLPYNDYQPKNVHVFGYSDFCVFVKKNTCAAQYLRHGHHTIVVEFTFTDLESFIEEYNSIHGKIHVELQKELETVLNSVNHWMYNQKHLDKKDKPFVCELIQYVRDGEFDEVLEKDGTTTFVLTGLDLMSTDKSNFQISFLGTKDVVGNLTEQELRNAYIGYTTF